MPLPLPDEIENIIPIFITNFMSKMFNLALLNFVKNLFSNLPNYATNYRLQIVENISSAICK